MNLFAILLQGFFILQVFLLSVFAVAKVPEPKSVSNERKKAVKCIELT